MVDSLTADQERRLKLWTSVAGLTRSQPSGKLSADQVSMLETLADNLEQLSQLLGQTADLAGRYLELARPPCPDANR
jgi:hypothetical protein